MLIINGSIRGSEGNSAKITKIAEQIAKISDASAQTLALAKEMPSIEEVKELLAGHSSFLVVTGNYWSSWGSPLQRFLEVVTAYENTSIFFGKPIACVVSMDSVGGIDIAARLHSVFSGLGCWSPPCSTVVLSRVGLEAIAASEGQTNDPNEDVWRLSDLNILVGNLLVSEKIKQDEWQKWPNIEFDQEGGSWPETGLIDYGSKSFL
jgi:chromate reductase